MLQLKGGWPLTNFMVTQAQASSVMMSYHHLLLRAQELHDIILGDAAYLGYQMVVSQLLNVM